MEVGGKMEAGRKMKEEGNKKFSGWNMYFFLLAYVYVQIVHIVHICVNYQKDRKTPPDVDVVYLGHAR